jgi:dihydrofolate reductase
MGKIVVTEFISLDGIVEDPGGAEPGSPAGWTSGFDRGAEGDQLKMAELDAADAQLLGRVTYDGFAAAWPAVEDEAGFGAKMNEMPKYVVSKTLHDPTWNNTTVLSGDPVAEITALRDKVARDILVAGSAQLVHLLATHELVDQYNLMIFPVLLGAGRRLFPDAAPEVPARFTATTVKKVGDVLWVVLQRDRSKTPPG